MKRKWYILTLLIFALIQLNSCQNKKYDSKTIVEPDSEGFYWPYVYIVHKNINKDKRVYILINPNNTGFPSNNYDKIKKETLRKFDYKHQRFKELNVVYMTPIFPRIKELDGNEYDFHSLEKNTFDLSQRKYQRIDKQLIFMIDDLKLKLKREYNFEVENKLLLYGFSSSGSFCDRLTFLQPSVIEAAAIGGCGLMLPSKTLKNENLPYPIGIYDFSQTFGSEFDEYSFSKIDRYIFKGTEDQGGTWTEEKDGKTTTYPWIDYLNITYAENFSEDKRKPVYIKGNLSDFDRLLIEFRISNSSFDQLNQFIHTKNVFSDFGYSKEENGDRQFIVNNTFYTSEKDNI